jgi:hypothetical protein
MSETVGENGKPYRIIGTPLHVRRWDQAQEAIVDGWEIKAEWFGNGSVIRVFVPEGVDIAEHADRLIRHQGEQLDALHS